MKGILAKKIGMTRLFNQQGELAPVTVLQPYENTIVKIKTKEIDGYSALVLGAKKVKLEKTTKPIMGLFKKAGLVDGFRIIREFRIADEEIGNYEVGKSLDLSLFDHEKHVDITGTSKGKGFKGVVARHGMAGGKSSHGNRMGRNPGSIGMCTYPGRVIKGKKLPGHQGDVRVTVQNVTIADLDKEKNLIFLKGAVPGARSGDVEIKLSIK